MNRFPNWLRWFLFLPLSIIASILVFVLVKLVTLLFDNFFLFQLFLILPGSGLTGYILVAGAAFLVPKLKVFVSILMALSYGLLSYFIFIKKAVLVDLIQLNPFELICLIVIGTMAALFACYQSYVNQKKLSQELIELERENQNTKSLENDKGISDPNSDILEDSLFQIINEFDTTATKPERKLIGQEKISSRSSISANSSNIYQNDSNFQSNEEDIIVSDLDSNDLEKEISQVMNVLDTDVAKSGVKSVSKQGLLSRPARTTKDFDIQPSISSEHKLRKKKQVPSTTTRELDQQISEIMSDMESGVKEVQKKTAPELSRPIRPVEREKSSDTFSTVVQKKDLNKERPAVVKNFKKREDKVLQSRPRPVPERIKSKRDDLLKKKEKRVPVSDPKDSARKTLQLPTEPIPEIIELKHEVLPKYDQLSSTDEVDKSSDTLNNARQKQNLKIETQVGRKDSKGEEKKVSHPQLETVPDKIKSKKGERLKTDKKYVPVPERKNFEDKPLQPQVKSVPKNKESRGEPLPKEEQIGAAVKIKKTREVPTEDLPAKELTDQKHASEKESLYSKNKPRKAVSKLSVVPEKSKTKRSIADDALISLADLDRLIELYQDDTLTEKSERVEDISEQNIKDSDQQDFQDVLEVEPGGQEPQSIKEKLLTDSTVPNKLIEAEPDKSFLQEFEGEDHFSYLNLEHLDEPVIQTTTELDILISESKSNQFMKYVEHYYQSVGEDENVALIHTEIFYLWCMMETVFEFSMDSEFRRNLIVFFNTRVGDLYLKWKEFTKSDTTKKISIDFNNFSYYSNQVRTNKIHLNSSFQNTDAEILFGKIVLKKIHECMGNKKVDVERDTILMPVQVYYELKQRVIEILNRTTDTICY